MLNTAAFSFAFLARAEYLAGEWDDAVLHAERAVAVNIEADLDFTRSMVFGIAALVPAARGDWEAAERAMEGTPRERGRLRASIVAVAMSRARIGEAIGDPEAVLAALEPVRRFPFRDGVDEPGFWAWPDLYAEALVGVGRAEEADALLGPHEQRAAARGRQSSIARLARARGRVEAALGRAEQAEAAFTRALAAVEKVAFPFDAARTRLAAGEFLRRAGQRRRAAELLTAAQQGFAELGAAPYAERCAHELAASGLRPGSAARTRREPAHRAGARRRPARRGGPLQPRDRRRTGGERQDGRVPPAQRVREARCDVAPPARRASGFPLAGRRLVRSAVSGDARVGRSVEVGERGKHADITGEGADGLGASLRQAAALAPGAEEAGRAFEAEPEGGRLMFENGTGTVRPAGDHLLLVAEAADEESLRHVEDVLARHLERFGARRELVVTWTH